MEPSTMFISGNEITRNSFEFKAQMKDEEWLVQRLSEIIIGGEVTSVGEGFPVTRDGGYKWQLGPGNNWWFDVVEKQRTKRKGIATYIVAYRYGVSIDEMIGIYRALIIFLRIEQYQT